MCIDKKTETKVTLPAPGGRGTANNITGVDFKWLVNFRPDSIA